MIYNIYVYIYISSCICLASVWYKLQWLRHCWEQHPISLHCCQSNAPISLAHSRWAAPGSSAQQSSQPSCLKPRGERSHGSWAESDSQSVWQLAPYSNGFQWIPKYQASEVNPPFSSVPSTTFHDFAQLPRPPHPTQGPRLPHCVENDLFVPAQHWRGMEQGAAVLLHRCQNHLHQRMASSQKYGWSRWLMQIDLHGLIHIDWLI